MADKTDGAQAPENTSEKTPETPANTPDNTQLNVTKDTNNQENKVSPNGGDTIWKKGPEDTGKPRDDNPRGDSPKETRGDKLMDELDKIIEQTSIGKATLDNTTQRKDEAITPAKDSAPEKAEELLDDILKQTGNPSQELNEMDIDSEAEGGLLDSSQDSIQVTLNNMTIRDTSQEDTPDEEQAIRRSMRNKDKTIPDYITMHQGARSKKNDKTEKLDKPEKKTEKLDKPEKSSNQEKPDKDTDQSKQKPLKKKKKAVKRPPTDQEQVIELKKIIQINDDLIEEDDKRIKHLEGELDANLKRVDEMTREIETRAEENTRMQQIVSKLELEKTEDKMRITRLEIEIAQKDKMCTEKLERQIQDLDELSTRQDTTIKKLEDENEAQRTRIRELEDLLETMRRRNTIQEKRIAQLKRTISSDEERPQQTKRTKPTPSHEQENTKPMAISTDTDQEEDASYKQSIRQWAFPTQKERPPTREDDMAQITLSHQLPDTPWSNPPMTEMVPLPQRKPAKFTATTSSTAKTREASPEFSPPRFRGPGRGQHYRNLSPSQKRPDTKSPAERRYLPTPSPERRYPHTKSPNPDRRYDRTCNPNPERPEDRTRHPSPVRPQDRSRSPSQTTKDPTRQTNPDRRYDRTRNPSQERQQGRTYNPSPVRPQERSGSPNQTTQDTTRRQSEPRPRIGVVTDSNGRLILNELKKNQYRQHNDYIAIQEYRTLEDLDRIVRHQAVVEELRTMDQIVIMMGTNNIKRGDNPEDMIKHLNQTIVEIARRTNTAIKTIEIPPIDPQRDPRGSRYVDTYNRGIAKPGKHIKLKRLRGEKIRDILTRDGIHLTEEGALRAAKDIHEQTLKAHSLEPQRKKQLQIPPEVTSRIIGKQGATIKRIEDKFKVRVMIDQNVALIRGTRRREAAEEIKEEIEDARVRAMYD